MRLHAGWLLGLLLSVPLASPAVGRASDGGPSPPAPQDEYWESATVDGARIGFAHTATEAIGDGPQRRLRTTNALELNLRRQGAAVRLRVEQGTEETPEGRVVAVSMRQYHDRNLRLDLAGALDGDRMRVVVDNGRLERRLPWADDVVGLAGRDRLFRERRPRPGDRFTFTTYEPIVNTLVTMRVAVGNPEEVATPAGKRRLLRADLTPDRLEAPGVSVQLPPTVLWLDDDFVPQRRQIEMDGLGVVLLQRVGREAALAPVGAAPRAADIGLKGLVPLDRAVPRAHASRSAVYRITLRGDADAAAAFVQDAHQEAGAARGESFELLVHPARRGVGRADAPEPGPEFREPCHFIDSDDPGVRELARRAAGGEPDPWRKAQRLERWVKANLRVDNAAPLASAAQVARDLRGDCRHAALLTAALCRAEGLPARTAIGLVYVERAGRPYLGFHMWTEVWVAGQWLGLDGTLGLGGVGAGHVKVTDHHWHDTPSLTPLLPLNRVLGKMTVEVLRVEAGP
jgi:transglutaminase-like putative cysteine protease